MSKTLPIISEFLDGRTRGPLIGIYRQPDYRQQPDPEKMVARACEVIRADGTRANRISSRRSVRILGRFRPRRCTAARRTQCAPPPGKRCAMPAMVAVSSSPPATSVAATPRRTTSSPWWERQKPMASMIGKPGG